MSTFRKLWVDDERPVPGEEWTSARSFHEAILKLELLEFDEVSLDHDLACFYNGKELTGYDVLMWLVERKVEGTHHVPVRVYVHSANPVGRDRMQAVIDRYFP